MSDIVDGLNKSIVHYQQCLEKYAKRNDEFKMLYCIGKLSKLPININHLKQTGVGRTVNSLRRVNGDVADAAKKLVNKWKEMVVEDSESDDTNKLQNYKMNKTESKKNQSSSSSREIEKSKKDENKETHQNDLIPKKDDDKTKYKNSHFKHNSHSSIQESDQSHSEEEHFEQEEKHRSHNYHKHKSSKHAYEQDESDNSEQERKHKHKHKSSKRKHEDNCNSDVIEYETKKSKKHKHQSYDDEIIFDDESYKIKKNKSSKSFCDNSDSQNTEEVQSKRKKHSVSEKRSSDNSQKEKTKDKSHKGSERKDRSSESNIKKQSESKHKEKPENDKPEKNKNESTEKSKKHKSDKHSHKKRKSSATENGIGSESGTSFAEALGMLEPPSSSQNKLSKKKTTIPVDRPVESSSSTTLTKSEVVIDVLAKKKLEPLDINLSSLLPEITPNYKPLGNIPVSNEQSKNKLTSEEEALGAILNSKILRTKVYSGNKVIWGKVPTLFELCTRILQENIDALEYTGGVPFSILKPVLEKANPDQLFMLEHHNPYLMEDTDELWHFHCQKEFRSKKREEMETWRDMYMRCLDEREAKLKALTANIKQSLDKSVPLRQTKLAYVEGHSIVKPPRNIAKKQAKYGTGGVEKKPTITPSSRLSALASGGAAAQIFVPNPGPKASTSSGSGPSHSVAVKPKKAPLMQKTLAFMKNRLFRR